VIVWFEDDAPAERFGGKGASLSRMVRAGLPVPPGFCVSTRGLDAAHSGDVVHGLEEALDRLGAAPVAVRSSAIGEDGTSASFAGIHRTVLNVRRDRVASALSEVRDSAFSDAARAYREKRGLPSEARMAAVVQAMVVPDVAGVLFTRDPVTKEDRIVIEGSWGLGEAIVSGIVTPDHWVVSRDGRVVEARIADKDVAIVATADGTAEVEVEADRRTIACLGEADLRAVVDLARTCERVFGGPQDIEWAVAAGRVYLLQSRPVTT